MRYETAVLGSLLELNGDCPPHLFRLLQFAPESFDDQRCGLTAKVIHQLRESGQPVHPAAVNERLSFPDSLTFLVQAVSSALPVQAAEFEAETVWKNFQSRRTATLFSEAADAIIVHPEQGNSIREHVISEIHRLSADADTLEERLAQRIYNVSTPREPTTVFSIGKIPICTTGNITTLSAQVKAGKSAAIGAMLASTFAGMDSDCLGFKSNNPKGFAVIHVDTEQSPFDHNRLIARAIARAGAQAAPEWLRSYCLTGFNPADIRRAIRPLLQSAVKQFGGVLALLLDGAADAVQDVNDSAEANALVAELHAQAIEFNCSIIGVIHLNPNSETKTRGHLGSQLERKAESNLRLEKDSDETITLFADKNRRAPISKSTGPRFAWSHDAGMHISVETRQQSKDNLEQEELENLFIKAFSNRPSMSYTDLKVTVKTALTVSEKTAERKITKAVTYKIVRKTFVGHYELFT